MKNSRENIRYIDNPDTGVKVAILEDDESPVADDALDIINKLIRNNSHYLPLIDPWDRNSDELIMKSVYKGVSKCNMSEDTYDKELGRKYAYRKCKEKYEAAKNKRLIKFLIDLWKLTEAVEEYLIKRGILGYCDETECCGNCEMCEKE